MKIIRRVAMVVFVAMSQQVFAQQLSQFTPLEHEKWVEQEEPLQLKVLGGVRYDSNLFRLSDDANAQAVIGSSDRSDFIYRLGAGGKYEIWQSRQKFILDANISEYKYQNFDNLDNTSSDLRGIWQWQAGNDWNGNLGIGHKRYLESFEYIQQNIRDMINLEQVYGSANYLLNSHLKLTLDSVFNDIGHGDKSRGALDARISNTAFTVNWVTPAQNTVGLQFRTADARFSDPNFIGAIPIDNAYSEHEYSLVTHWIASGVSELTGRVGYTQRKFDELPNRNFSDPTWRLTYLWQVTGKTSLEFATWREIQNFQDLTSNFVRATGVGIVPTWSVTHQLVLRGKVSYENRRFVGDPGIVPIVERREDKFHLYQLSALWTPLRLTEVGLTVESGRRTSNEALGDYHYEAVGLLATRYF